MYDSYYYLASDKSDLSENGIHTRCVDLVITSGEKRRFTVKFVVGGQFHNLPLIHWDFQAQPSLMLEKKQTVKIQREKFQCEIKCPVNVKGQRSGWAKVIEVIEMQNNLTITTGLN